MLTREGYFKKITFQSLRGNDEQKLKENDAINQIIDAENRDNLLIFTDKSQVFRVRAADFDTTKASAMGDFLNAKLGMDKDERPVFMKIQNSYGAGENMVFLFANGKGVRIPISAYETKGNRKKLTGAYSANSPLVGIFAEQEADPFEIMLITDAGRGLVFKSSLIPVMNTRSSGGVTLINFGRRETKVTEALSDFSAYGDGKGYRKYKLPATGVPISDKYEDAIQLKIYDDTKE